MPQSSGAHHAHAQLGEIGAVGGHEVGRYYRANARGRAGEDEIAGLELPGGGEVRDDLRNFPDQIGDPAVLAAYAVHIQRDLDPREVLDPGRGGDSADRRRAVECLGDAPGTAALLHLTLQIAACHVEPHRIAVDAALHIDGSKIRAALAHGDDQLDLVVQVLRQGRIPQNAGLALPDRQDGIGRLHEEKRWLAPALAHLSRVIRVVAADTVDAVDWKPAGRPDDPHGRMRRRSEDIAHGRTIIRNVAGDALSETAVTSAGPGNSL